MGQYYDLPRSAYRKTETCADSDEPTTELGGAMSSKREFTYKGEKWEASEGAPVGSDSSSQRYYPKASRRRVIFKCLSHPSRPELTWRLGALDLAQASDGELGKLLEGALRARGRGG